MEAVRPLVYKIENGTRRCRASVQSAIDKNECVERFLHFGQDRATRAASNICLRDGRKEVPIDRLRAFGAEEDCQAMT
jgi:hypothetical protein